MKTLNSKYVFFNSQKDVILKSDKDNEWHPINFQWIPVINLKEDMINTGDRSF